MSQSLSGAEFKKQLREGKPKMGLFINSHSPTVVEQLAFSGYDWLLVDSQHGPMGYETLSGMLAGISNGGAISLVRVGGHTRPARHPAGFGHGRQRNTVSLRQHCGRRPAICNLLPLPYSRNPIRVLSAAQYEREGFAGLCRRMEQ